MSTLEPQRSERARVCSEIGDRLKSLTEGRSADDFPPALLDECRDMIAKLELTAIVATSVDPTRETEREYAWRVYANDALRVLDERDAPSTKCRQPLCRADVWWGVTAVNRRRTCFDIKPTGERTGTNHWRTCRQRPERRR